MITIVKCWKCESSHELDVPTEGWAAWQSGELIQEALSGVSASDRELLISGTCGECFDEMFGDVQEDEDIWEDEESGQ